MKQKVRKYLYHQKSRYCGNTRWV